MGPPASPLPHILIPEILPRRMPGPPCSSCALCHWLRWMMSWYCWATSGGTGRCACLKARIWGGAEGVVRALPGPADPQSCPTEPCRMGTHLPLQTLLVEGQHAETMQGPG